MLAEDRTTESDRELIMEGRKPYILHIMNLIIQTNFTFFFPFLARKKQTEKLKKMSSVKTDSCETDSVAEDGNDKILEFIKPKFL